MIGPCDPTRVPVQCILTDTLDILSRADVTWTSMLDGSPLYLRLKPPCPVPPKVNISTSALLNQYGGCMSPATPRTVTDNATIHGGPGPGDRQGWV